LISTFPSRARRAATLFAGLLALAGAVPAVAAASHEQGGYITTDVTANGHLRGTVAYLTKGSCTVGTSTSIPGVTVTNPLASSVGVPVTGAHYTRCLPGSTTREGTFDIDIATEFGGIAPDGDYTVTFASCCRVSGIQNKVAADTQFEAKVHKTLGQASSAPVLASNVSTWIAKGYAYDQFLNASDPDGGALTYSSRAGQVDGPDSDVVTYSSAGEVVIPAATTANFLNGQSYVYKVRVIDAQGDYAERDVLLTVTANNKPPAIDGLDGSSPYRVTAGTTRVITFSGTDPNNAAPKVDSVSLSATGLPAWATLSTTPGNPAQASITLSPPANLAPATLGLNVDAVDSDTTAPLTATANIQVQVTAVAPPPPVITASPNAAASSASFTFAGRAGDTFECRIDGGSWAACISPSSPPGLGDGAHMFEVRALDGAANASDPASRGWTKDTVAPAHPTLLATPAARSAETSATFEFAGETSGSWECRLDAGAWGACVSPRSYSGLSAATHTFGVRQTDPAGNAGLEQSFTWKAGVSGADGPGRNLDVALPPNATAAVHGSSATVGCRVAAGSLSSCSVRAYGYPRRGRAGTRVRAARSKAIFIGWGRVTARSGSSRLSVDIRLNAAGRRLMARQLAGVQVLLKMTARTTAGATLATQRHGRFVPERQLVIPASGTFASGSATLTPAGRRFVRSVARRVRNARSITCAGHTDSIGSASRNRRLGRRRAAATCAYLRRAGVRAHLRSVSYGKSRPRATNATSRGRALNRRVELAVRYR
jgi:outer membrane protein OmpA-like peptidoglycan-associated protein